MEKNIQVFKPIVCDEAIEAVSNVLRSGWTGNGTVTQLFEQDVQQYLGGGIAIAVNSATAGLQIALQLMDVGEGDEIISVGNTFVSSNHVILYQQATPVFVDIEKETGCIDVEKIEEKITTKTKAIICVHLSGLVCNIQRLREIADKHNLYILHDCAHSFGSEYFGDKVGNVKDRAKEIAVFSCQSVKNLSIGDLGLILCPTQELADRAKRLRWMGISTSTHDRTEAGKYKYKYECDELGWKANATDIMSAIGREQLKHLDKGNARRAQIAAFYKTELEGFQGMQFAQVKSGVKSAFHFTPALVSNRDDLLEHLQKHSVSAGMHYVNNARYKVYEPYRVDLPNTEWWTEHEITLPIHLGLSDSDLQYVVDTIKRGW